MTGMFDLGMPKARERVCSICGSSSKVTRNKFKVITTVAVEKLLISSYQSRYASDLSVPLLGTSVHETFYNSLYGWYHYQSQVKEVSTNNTSCLNPISNNMQKVHHSEHQSSLEASGKCTGDTRIVNLVNIHNHVQYSARVIPRNVQIALQFPMLCYQNMLKQHQSNQLKQITSSTIMIIFCKSNEITNSDVIWYDSDEDASSHSSDLTQNFDSSDDLTTFG
ncbi:unnamed protein product [Rotaria socialis]|uniref:Uncharacterized protein n=1 Tax=Rotaria socialis TaxID=392032 RepID=A0A821IHG1_9BILA|nr:unnamed protein product [Rotaria socialis]